MKRVVEQLTESIGDQDSADRTSGESARTGEHHSALSAFLLLLVAVSVCPAVVIPMATAVSVVPTSIPTAMAVAAAIPVLPSACAPGTLVTRRVARGEGTLPLSPARIRFNVEVVPSRLVPLIKPATRQGREICWV